MTEEDRKRFNGICDAVSHGALESLPDDMRVLREDFWFVIQLVNDLLREEARDDHT